MRIVQSRVAGGPWVCLPERRHFWDVVLTWLTQGDCRVHDVKATCIPRHTWCLLTAVLYELEGSDMYLPGINVWATSRGMSRDQHWARPVSRCAFNLHPRCLLTAWQPGLQLMGRGRRGSGCM